MYRVSAIGKPLLFALMFCAAGAKLPLTCASAQDTQGFPLPDSAKLALRARTGDLIKVETDEKVTTHIHLEAISGEFSSESTYKDNSSYVYKGRGPNGTLMFEAQAVVKGTTTNTSFGAEKPISARASGLYTLKP